MLLDLHLSKIPNSISTLVGSWFIPRITVNLPEMKHYCAKFAHCMPPVYNCKLQTEAIPIWCFVSRKNKSWKQTHVVGMKTN